MKDRKGFHSATGMVQSPFLNIESMRSINNAQSSPNMYKFRDASSNRKIEQQFERAVREIISIFMDTLSAIFLK